MFQWTQLEFPSMATPSIAWRRCNYTGHIILSTEYKSRVTIKVINASYNNFVPQLQPAEKSVQWNKCLLKINISNHFIGKRPAKKSFLLVFFFIFSLHNPRPKLISRSRSSPHHNQSFYTMFFFCTMLGSLFKSIIFSEWNARLLC